VNNEGEVAMTRQLHLLTLASPGGLGGRGNVPSQGGPAAVLGSVAAAVKQAEEAGFDAVLLADFVAGPSEPAAWKTVRPTYVDPIVAAGAIAGVTSKIGIIVTLSTTFDHPYHIARQVLSLDHFSGGRLAWNVVTSMSEGAAHTFGLDAMPPHSLRYARAAEVVDVVMSLWDSFSDDGEAYATSYKGEHITTNGVLGLPRSPQGRPPLVQAGSSEDGLDFASRYAEAVFIGQDSFERTKAVRDALIQGSRALGRSHAPLALSSLHFVIGDTEEEALALERQVEERTPVISQLQNIKKYFEAGQWNVTPDDLDVPLPPFPEHTELRQTGLEYYRRVAAEKEDWTVREFLHRTRGGHMYSFVGTASALAGEMERWFREGAADGFILGPRGSRDQQMQLFIDKVLPVLRSRGLARPQYEGSTLREHLGLDRPANVHEEGKHLVASR
jgi:FMN-dependent oxidoreductase (nitrilotriacetate monooxygenase family)